MPFKRPFFRPELDALRFFAFFSVFLFHAPRFSGTAYPYLAHGLGAALPLFFLLSAFLITELLLREREQTGTVHLASFYWRRALRIWPLYYAGVALAVLASTLAPHRYHLNHHQILYLGAFLGWLDGSFNGNPFGHLWSISVEELFYLIWPGIALLGSRSVLVGSSLIALVSLYFAATHYAWYDPRPHFLFFSTGALLAVLLHSRHVQPAPYARGLLMLVGLLSWAWGTPVVAPHPPSAARGLANFLAMDIGCVCIFFAFYRLPPRLLPAWLQRLGKISYGLYVFHLLALFTATYLAGKLGLQGSAGIAIQMAFALLLTIAVAHFSFQYFETPFLRWKKRFEVVPSGSGVLASKQ